MAPPMAADALGPAAVHDRRPRRRARAADDADASCSSRARAVCAPRSPTTATPSTLADALRARARRARRRRGARHDQRRAPQRRRARGAPRRRATSTASTPATTCTARNRDWLVTREGLEVVTDPEALADFVARRCSAVDQVRRRDARGLAVELLQVADRLEEAVGGRVLDEVERLAEEPVVGADVSTCAAGSCSPTPLRLGERARRLHHREPVRAPSTLLERLHEQRRGRPAVGDDAVARRRRRACTSAPAPCTASSRRCSPTAGRPGPAAA